jgi:hypothetical protein
VSCREDGTPLDRWQVRKEFQKITGADRLGGAWTPRELRHSFVSILSAHDVRQPGLRRFLRRTPGGLPRINKAAIKREAGLDGKWLLRTNDETLTPMTWPPPASS